MTQPSTPEANKSHNLFVGERQPWRWKCEQG